MTVFLPKLRAKGGERIENTTTSKGLIQSNDHIKENWGMIEGEHPPNPPLGESLMDFEKYYTCRHMHNWSTKSLEWRAGSHQNLGKSEGDVSSWSHSGMVHLHEQALRGKDGTRSLYWEEVGLVSNNTLVSCHFAVPGGREGGRERKK